MSTGKNPFRRDLFRGGGGCSYRQGELDARGMKPRRGWRARTLLTSSMVCGEATAAEQRVDAHAKGISALASCSLPRCDNLGLVLLIKCCAVRCRLRHGA